MAPAVDPAPGNSVLHGADTGGLSLMQALYLESPRRQDLIIRESDPMTFMHKRAHRRKPLFTN